MLCLSSISNNSEKLQLNSPQQKILSRWLGAVQLGAQGQYIQAYRILEYFFCPQTEPFVSENFSWILSSLAHSTSASHFRQCGHYQKSYHFDAQALALTTRIDFDAFSPPRWIAYLDALTGLAADSIGLHKFYRAQRILDECQKTLSRFMWKVDTSSDFFTDSLDFQENIYMFSWHRVYLRWLWVQLELALHTQSKSKDQWIQNIINHISDDNIPGISVDRHHSIELPLRWRMKSYLMLYAALGELEKPILSVSSLNDCLTILRDNGYYPLAWAACLLADDVNEAQKMRNYYALQTWLG